MLWKCDKNTEMINVKSIRYLISFLHEVKKCFIVNVAFEREREIPTPLLHTQVDYFSI